jgi:hypothetical protein
MVEAGKLSKSATMQPDTVHGYGIKHWTDGRTYEGMFEYEQM